MKLKPLSILIIIFTIVPIIMAQDDADSFTADITRLNDNLYQITCNGWISTNTVALTGQDGILLIESGLHNTADALKESLQSISDGDLKFIINTHMHADHTGANNDFPDEVVIIAHEKARERIGGKYYHLEPYLTEGLPDITFNDTLTLYFNDQKLKLIYFPDSHTDGDIIVYLPDYKIVCMGDLFFAEGFPFVDLANGGNVTNYIRTIEKIADMMPDDILYLPGHGEIFTRQELLDNKDTLKASIAMIRSEMAQGHTAQDMIDAGLLDRWKDWNKNRFVSNDQWIIAVFNSLYRESAPGYTSICEPVTQVLAAHGIGEAIRAYRELKRNYPGRYDYGENQLNNLGYQLLGRDMIDEAMAVFKLNIEAYPEAANTYDSMGEACLIKGDTLLAVDYFKRSLRLNPENTNASDILKKLETD